MLTTAPLLVYPDFSQQFILDTDTSDVGIGAVLSQIDDEGRECVIAYGSQVLTKAPVLCNVEGVAGSGYIYIIFSLLNE